MRHAGHSNLSTLATAPQWRRWGPPICMGLAAMVMGTIGFMTHDGAGFFNALYLSLQLFVLHSVHLHDPIPWYLHLGRLLAVATVFYAGIGGVLYVFRDEVVRWRARRWKQHTIVCGLGRKGLQLIAECH